MLGSVSSSSSEWEPGLQWGWKPGEREVEGSVREPSLPTVVSMAIMYESMSSRAKSSRWGVL